MTYSKRFFLAITIVMILIILGLESVLRPWIPPPADIALLSAGFFTMGALGRTSDTISEQFARLFARMVFIMPFRTVLGLVLNMNIRSPEVTATANGHIEVEYESFQYNEVLDELKQFSNPPEVLRVDMGDFQIYLKEARYDRYYPDYYKGAPKYLVHKQLQHYLSILLTPILGSETWIDVASSTSPFPDILTRLFHIDVYRQDLSYPPGVRGIFIGSNAAAIPLPDRSIDRISLHCSFEHFEKHSDTAFLREIVRLLRPGGIACIIPLYVSNTYQILTNPRYWLPRGIPREKDAQTTVSRTYWENHGRFYDGHSLSRRVIRPLQELGLDYSVLQIQIPAELDYPPFLVLKIRKV